MIKGKQPVSSNGINRNISEIGTKSSKINVNRRGIDIKWSEIDVTGFKININRSKIDTCTIIQNVYKNDAFSHVGGEKASL